MGAVTWFIDPQNLTSAANDANPYSLTAGNASSAPFKSFKRYLDLVGRRQTIPRGALVDVTLLSDMTVADRASFEVTLDDPLTAAFRLHGSLVPSLQTTVTTFTASAPASNGRATLVAAGLTSAHVRKLLFFPATNAWSIATACPSTGTLRITPPRSYASGDSRTITAVIPATSATVLVYEETRGYFGSVGLVAAWNASGAPGVWPSPFLFERFDLVDLISFDGSGGVYQAAEIRQCTFADVVTAASSSNLFRACSFTANAGATSFFDASSAKPVSFSGCAFFGGDIAMSGARFGVGNNDANAILCTQVTVDRSCTIRGELEISTPTSGEASGLWVSNGMLSFATTSDTIYGAGVGNNVLVLDHAGLRYADGVQVYATSGARQILVGGLGASTDLTPTLISNSPASCDTWAKLLAAPFNGSAYNAADLSFIRSSTASGGGLALSLRASTLTTGTSVSAWGSYTQSTPSARPTVITDSVTGNKAVRFDAGQSLSGPAIQAMHKADTTVLVVWRQRNYAPAAQYGIYDSSGDGATPGAKLHIRDQPGLGALRVIRNRISNGSSWVVDHNADAGAPFNSFAALKWNATAITTSATRSTVNVDLSPAYDDTISVTLPTADSGPLVFGGTGQFDIQAIDVYSPALSDADRDIAIRALGVECGIDLCYPVNSDGFNNYMNACGVKLANGQYFIVYRTGTTHGSSDGRIESCTSTDQGKTWSAPTVIRSPISPTQGWRDPCVRRLANGHLVLTYFCDDDLLMEFRKSTDNGVTWSAPTNFNSMGYDALMTGSGPILESQGKLLLPVYVMKTTDSPQRWSIRVFRSPDEGTTWPDDFLVAAGSLSDPTKEGWSELGLALLDNGDIYGLARDEGSADMFSFLSTAASNGAVWSAPSARHLGALSAGRMLTLASGKLLYLGRPNSLLAATLFTADGPGYTNWKVIPEAPGIDARDGVMVYGGMWEDSPGRIAIAFCTQYSFNPNPGGTPGYIQFRYWDEWQLNGAMPMPITPPSASVATSATQQFSAVGAGNIVWSVDNGGAAATINSTTGLFTAGGSAGSCVVRATDLNSYSTTANVTITGSSTTPPTGIDAGNITLWLDPTAGRSIGGGLVNTWTSQEGGAHVWTRTGGPIPGTGLNGHTSIDFDGIQDGFYAFNDTLATYLTSGSWTIAWACKDTGSPADTGIYFENSSIFNDGGSGNLSVGTTDVLAYAGQDGNVSHYDSVAQTGGTVNYYVAQYDSVAGKIFISKNGGAFDAGTTVSTIPGFTGIPQIGKSGITSHFFKGSLGDICIWKSKLSAPNLLLIQQYLAAKYA